MFDTMTFTKIVGGLCGALLIFLMGKWAAELIYHGAGGHGEDHAQGYVIETGDDGSEGDSEADSGPSFAQLFVEADTGKGERVFNKCKACHSLEEGDNGTGPYLHGVVGRDVGSVDGFSYSGSLVAVADVWTPENLSHFLENPAGYAPGTAMGFSGLGSIEDRANLIAFLDQTDGDTYEMEVPEEASSEEGGDEAAAEEASAEGEEQSADEGSSEEQASEDGSSDEGAAEEQASEEGSSDEGAAEEQASEEGSSEEGAAEEQASEEGSSDEGAAEEQASEEGSSDEGAAEEQASEEGASDEGAAEEEASEEQSSDEGSSEEQSGFASMVASADPADGEKVFRKCKACHVADSEQNRVGPHLVGLVGRDVASVEGFRYSSALEEFGGQWTEDRLNQWLENSNDLVPGNKMSFAGLKSEDDRAAVVAYIESLAN
ncbi:c-type cytochrome [Roseovarius indicus]|uniref:c-type cytochrome n=2 Tax=Roseovarius indicus TaxID=540747 RepID=UPI003511AFBD